MQLNLLLIILVYFIDNNKRNDLLINSGEINEQMN